MNTSMKEYKEKDYLKEKDSYLQTDNFSKASYSLYKLQEKDEVSEILQSDTETSREVNPIAILFYTMAFLMAAAVVAGFIIKDEGLVFGGVLFFFGSLVGAADASGHLD
jgi:hypothetical protein